MNRIVFVAAAALIAGAAFAQKPSKAPAAPAQTKCVVMNEALGAHPISIAYTGKNAAYKGKSVKVCCEGCTAAVKKDQDKYFKMVFAKK